MCEMYEIDIMIDDLRCCPELAEHIADDRYWDGHNLERDGGNEYLFRAPEGHYFVVGVSAEWMALELVSVDTAIYRWEDDLRNHVVSFEKAFPDVEIEDA